jgi:hypothetical protein
MAFPIAVVAESARFNLPIIAETVNQKAAASPVELSTEQFQQLAEEEIVAHMRQAYWARIDYARQGKSSGFLATDIANQWRIYWGRNRRGTRIREALRQRAVDMGIDPRDRNAIREAMAQEMVRIILSVLPEVLKTEHTRDLYRPLRGAYLKRSGPGERGIVPAADLDAALLLHDDERYDYYRWLRGRCIAAAEESLLGEAPLQLTDVWDDEHIPAALADPRATALLGRGYKPLWKRLAEVPERLLRKVARTDAQRRILALLLEGKAPAEIAAIEGIATVTVHTTLQRWHRKIQRRLLARITT